MCYAAKKDKNLFIKIFVVLTIIYTILILDGYLQFFTGVNIIGLEKTGIRVSSFFGDELILGSYIARFFPIYIGLLFLTFKKRQVKLYEKIFFVIFIILISILVLISGERTAFALLFLSFLFMFFFIDISKRKKNFYFFNFRHVKCNFYVYLSK